MKKSDNIAKLKKFMAARVLEGSSIENWNDVREEAKEFFKTETIAQLDGSGYIKQFKLYSY